jgi:hypothetical protein
MAKQYKKPENAKYKSRTDLKDYTTDDKDGGMNPKSTGEKQTNVLRKTDKEVVDTGDMYIKYNADDRLYKDIEDGEYDPKHAAKVLKKRQDADEKLSKDQLKDKVENLTREGKELFIRKYIQANILKILKEAEEPVDPNAAPVVDPTLAAPVDPTMSAPVDPTAAPVDPTMSAPVDPTAAPIDPAMSAPIDPSAAVDPNAAPVAPAPEAPAAEPVSPTSQVTSDLAKKNTIEKIDALSSIIKNALAETEPSSKIHFYKLFFSNLLKQRAEVVQANQESSEETSNQNK